MIWITILSNVDVRRNKKHKLLQINFQFFFHWFEPSVSGIGRRNKIAELWRGGGGYRHLEKKSELRSSNLKLGHSNWSHPHAARKSVLFNWCWDCEKFFIFLVYKGLFGLFYGSLGLTALGLIACFRVRTFFTGPEFQHMLLSESKYRQIKLKKNIPVKFIAGSFQFGFDTRGREGGGAWVWLKGAKAFLLLFGSSTRFLLLSVESLPQNTKNKSTVLEWD